MKPSQNCIDLIKKFEGCVLHPYLDAVKVPTIGYGNTFYLDGAKVSMKDKTITQAQADALLISVVNKFAAQVNALIKAPIKAPITQGQFDALVSFAYNLGVGNLASSTLLKMVNAGNKKGATQEFLKWTKAGGVVLQGLVNRRMAEQKLFLS